MIRITKMFFHAGGDHYVEFSTGPLLTEFITLQKIEEGDNIALNLNGMRIFRGRELILPDF